MYTLNDGVFSTKMTVAYYYIMVLLMIILNVIFSRLEGDMEPCLSLRNWIGKDMELDWESIKSSPRDGFGVVGTLGFGD